MHLSHQHALLGRLCSQFYSTIGQYNIISLLTCIQSWCTCTPIRYPYYILSVLEMEAKVLTWLRYIAWIPLYPIGFTCEGVYMYMNHFVVCCYCFVSCVVIVLLCVVVAYFYHSYYIVALYSTLQRVRRLPVESA